MVAYGRRIGSNHSASASRPTRPSPVSHIGRRTGSRASARRGCRARGRSAPRAGGWPRCLRAARAGAPGRCRIDGLFCAVGHAVMVAPRWPRCHLGREARPLPRPADRRRGRACPRAWKPPASTACSPPRPPTARSSRSRSAAEHTERVALITNIAVAFARSPMDLAAARQRPAGTVRVDASYSASARRSVRTSSTATRCDGRARPSARCASSSSRSVRCSGAGRTANRSRSAATTTASR